jgi:hypothetical protein
MGSNFCGAERIPRLRQSSTRNGRWKAEKITRTIDDVIEKWRRWRALGANDRRETLRAAMLVPLCGAGVRVLGVKRTREWLAVAAQPSRRAGTSAIERVVRAVERVRFHSPLSGTCLSRSLTLHYLLLRHGMRSELRLGVRRIGSRVAGHAWIEVNGSPLNDTPDVHSEFAPLHK